MRLTEESCKEFILKLSSSSPVPGGGGASAMVGALGAALGNMVGNLTLGKKKYENVQEDIKALLDKGDRLCKELLRLVEKDAEVFEPLSKAYGLPRNTEEERKLRDEVLEEALKSACSVPLDIMEAVAEAIGVLSELASKGTRIAISDVGAGLIFCKSALMGASLNVLINTKMMKDRKYAEELNSMVDTRLREECGKADRLYGEVEDSLR
jgi:formiminotetrahydrofolate cyclodeaminase